MRKREAPAGVAETGEALNGVYSAVVTDVRDPEALGRVKVRLSALRNEPWARVATLMAGDARGTWFVPDPGDEVLVAFEAGDPRRAYVLGALWNSSDRPPETMDGAGTNPRRVIRTRSGTRIAIDDTPGDEELRLELAGGERVVLRHHRVEIADTNGNQVTLTPAGASLTAAARVSVAAGSAELNAGLLTINAGFARFAGVVQCTTLRADSVVASSYTPGVGNIW
jgi:uncharacterized protein involved in type VI secretion and phage assembly